MAGRGARGAGGRRALVRARQPERSSATSTSTPTRAARSTAASPPSRRARAPRSPRRRARSCSAAARSPTRSSSSSSGGRTLGAGGDRQRQCPTSSRSPTRTTRFARTTTGAPCSSTARKVAKQLKLAAPLADLAVDRRPVRARDERHRDRGRRHAGDRDRARSPCAARAALDLVHERAALAAAAGEDGHVRRQPLADRLSRAAPTAVTLEAKGRGRRLGARGRAAPRRRRLVRDDRQAGRGDAVPARLGDGAGGPRDGRGRRRASRPQSAPTGVQGTERPVVAGAAVQLQRQDGTAWTTVSSTTADAARRLAFSGALQPGHLPRPLRARATASSPGVSATLPGAVRRALVLGARGSSCWPRPAVALGVRQHRAARGEAVVPRRRTTPGRSGRRRRSSPRSRSP